jgi:hypothetical protein
MYRIGKLPQSESLVLSLPFSTVGDECNCKHPRENQKAGMPGSEKISINTAPPKQLTQLPGIGKDTAYRIVNHRKRHGFFTHWEELAEVREFPTEKIEEIKKRATLKCPPGEDCFGPRRVKPSTIERVAKKTRGYTKAKRNTRRQERLGRAA